jgi:hypothetical protein
MFSSKERKEVILMKEREGEVMSFNYLYVWFTRREIF